MKKRKFLPVDGVSNIELFYDLIFVYCISVLTSLMHHVHGDFFDLATWSIYMFSFSVVLQVWLFTTLLMNRYGDRSASDNTCLFINMFLLYFLASGIQAEWENSIFTFNIAWALILLNLMAHWIIKLVRYDNLDECDRHIMRRVILMLGVQFVIVLIAAFLPERPSEIMSWLGLLVGVGVFTQRSSLRKKPSRFSHLSERCSLLVIIAFGETIVAIASYMGGKLSIWYAILVFALVVGLFLIYMYEHDNMTDHHRKTDGMAYLTITAWIIMIIGNVTVALEYMPMEEIAFLPKSIYLTAGLVLYLLTSFVLGYFNKPEFRQSAPFAVGRLSVCAFIVLVAVVTNFDPFINLVCDTLAVFFALWHEWLLFHERTKMLAFGHSLGMTDDEMIEHVDMLNTREGRRTVRDAMRNARKERKEKQSNSLDNG